MTNGTYISNAFDKTNITTITSLDGFFSYSDFVFNLLIALNILIILLSIVGNGIVIYGSKMFNAIKMDKTSLIFLENLAYADILIAIIFYLPITLTLITRRWVLGEMLCFVNAFFTSTPSIAEIWILMAISVHRIWAVKNPFIPEIKNKYTYSIVACLWLLAISPPIVWIIMPGLFAYYDPLSLSCLSSVYTDTEMVSLAMSASVLLVGLPLMVVVVCNIYLLYISIAHSKRMGGNLSKMAVLTITVICWTFVISWSPFIVKVLLPMFTDTIPPWFYIFQIEILSLNVTLNPLIYTVTNRRFRNFLFYRVFHIKKRRDTGESMNYSTSGRNVNVEASVVGSRAISHRMSLYPSPSPPAV